MQTRIPSSSVSRDACEAVQQIYLTLYKCLSGSSSSLLFDRTWLQTNSQRNRTLTHMKSPSKPPHFNRLRTNTLLSWRCCGELLHRTGKAKDARVEMLTLVIQVTDGNNTEKSRRRIPASNFIFLHLCLHSYARH